MLKQSDFSNFTDLYWENSNFRSHPFHKFTKVLKLKTNLTKSKIAFISVHVPQRISNWNPLNPSFRWWWRVWSQGEAEEAEVPKVLEEESDLLLQNHQIHISVLSMQWVKIAVTTLPTPFQLSSGDACGSSWSLSSAWSSLSFSTMTMSGDSFASSISYWKLPFNCTELWKSKKSWRVWNKVWEQFSYQLWFRNPKLILDYCNRKILLSISFFKE